MRALALLALCAAPAVVPRAVAQRPQVLVAAPRPATDGAPRAPLGFGWRYDDMRYVVRTGEAPPDTFPVHPTVTRLRAGSPAAAAGLADGDVLLEVNGRDGRTRGIFRDVRPGTAYTLRVRRGDAERVVRFTLPAAPGRPVM